jgi:hypothetical protein
MWVAPARPGFHHPAGAYDIAELLAFFGPTVTYGLRRIELRPHVANGRPATIAALRVPGVVILYEQTPPPWVLPGRPTDASLRRLHRAGAVLTVGASVTRIDWPATTLPELMLFDGLLHEIGHHMLQRAAGKGASRVRRTADHERYADDFAADCRRAWTARLGSAP